MKKLFSFVMAVAMMACISVSVLADDPDPNAFTAAGSVTMPTIDVSIGGGAGKVFVNPYKFPVAFANGNGSSGLAANADAAAEAAEAQATTHTKDGILSPTYWLANNTVLPLDVYVNGKAIPTNITMATGPVVATSTKKEVFLYATFKNVGTGATDAEWDEDEEVVKHFAPGDYDKNNKSNFIFGTAEAKAPQKVIDLPASTSQADVKKVAFQFTGSVAPNPATEWDASADTIEVQMTFTYKLNTTATT